MACCLSWFDQPTHTHEQLPLARRCKTAGAVHYASTMIDLLNKTPLHLQQGIVSLLSDLFFSITSQSLWSWVRVWNVDQLVSWKLWALSSESAFTAALRYGSRITTVDVSGIRVPPGGFSLCLSAVYNWEETLVWNQYLLEGLYFLSGWGTP